MAEQIRLEPAKGAELHYRAVCELCGMVRDFGLDREKAVHRIALHNRMEHEMDVLRSTSSGQADSDTRK